MFQNSTFFTTIIKNLSDRFIRFIMVSHISVIFWTSNKNLICKISILLVMILNWNCDRFS
ncbi:hypothetical protein MtrunA17_Chr2g0301151 [Medicago truncatula]|uniref:Uncharacterized protein n=1 Tax=Medicago truncatula TaxID=3880 RepID=A0A396J8K3_MEDTR|nr:hypothetical protein MtrunA17_Chr2g0301151 [Medicago truncatula]